VGSLIKKTLFHFRFFYDNIWREWDADDDGDYCFASRHLETRLQLYHEIQDGNLPKDLVQRYKGTLLTLMFIVRQTGLIYHLLFNNFSFLKFPKNKSKWTIESFGVNQFFLSFQR